MYSENFYPVHDAHTCNPDTQKAKVEGLLQVWDQPDLQNEYHVSQRYIARPCFTVKPMLVLADPSTQNASFLLVISPTKRGTYILPNFSRALSPQGLEQAIYCSFAVILNLFLSRFFCITPGEQELCHWIFIIVNSLSFAAAGDSYLSPFRSLVHLLRDLKMSLLSSAGPFTFFPNPIDLLLCCF